MRHPWPTALALVLAACTSGSRPGDISPDEARGVVDDLNKAYAGGDAATIMDHYANDAVVIDAAHVAPTTDRQLQTQWTGQFASMHPATYRLADLAIRPMGPDSFVATGLASFTADVGQGRDVLHVRSMQAFRKQDDGKWRVVAEHISMPPPGPGL